MLQTLYIENFAIIDQLTVEFSSGLNILTGETGAGKSIIIGALKLLLGGKSTKESIRSGEKGARVEAIFCLTDEIKKEIQLDGFDVADEVLLQREINETGRSRCSINGRPVTQDILKKISERLISISSQHDYQRLLRPAVHSKLMDNYADKSETRRQYEKAWNEWNKDKEYLQNFEDDIQKAKQERDYLDHEYNELKKLDLDNLDAETLEIERKKLKGAVKFREVISTAVNYIYEENGATEKLAATEKILADVELPEVHRWLDVISRANSELSDLGNEMSSILVDLVEDPTRLEELEDKIHSMRGIERRFGSIDDAIERRNRLEGILSNIENSEHKLKELKNNESISRKSLNDISIELSKKRKHAAIGLSREVEKNLKSLAFSYSNFIVNFNELSELSPTGKEEVEFLFSPNQGEEPKSLVKIASGGELSRLHLSLSRVVGEVGEIVVYDEVDAGIGGETANAVGKLLRDASSNSQVVCITHLPQIAGFGNHHLSVRKEVVDGRTFTKTEIVEGEDRVKEIARLLGGIGETSIKHAKEMLNKSL